MSVYTHSRFLHSESRVAFWNCKHLLHAIWLVQSVRNKGTQPKLLQAAVTLHTTGSIRGQIHVQYMFFLVRVLCLYLCKRKMYTFSAHFTSGVIKMINDHKISSFNPLLGDPVISRGFFSHPKWLPPSLSHRSPALCRLTPNSASEGSFFRWI